MKIACISDTHGRKLDVLPSDIDVFVHCGDWSNSGSKEETLTFLKQIDTVDVEHILICPGNHDIWVGQNIEESKELFKQAGALLLIDEPLQINGFNFYSMPWVPICGPWEFTLGSSELTSKSALIPDNLDCLITHGPSYGILDKNKYNSPCGAISLTNAVLSKNPRYHVHGHIHESKGISKLGDTTVVNCYGYKGHYSILSL